jgi:DNA-binding transcriptional regulator YiaG
VSEQYQVKRRQWDGEHIHALREHLGLTQRELADRLGTRQQTISEWERGMYKPRGASATLLSIIAERANFEYQATASKKSKKADQVSPDTWLEEKHDSD